MPVSNRAQTGLLPARRLLAIALAASLLQGIGLPAWAQAASAEQGSGATRQQRFTLKQLGAAYPMQLRGIEGSNSVPFSVRADELVSSARLRLSYVYSPALLSDISHINVLVNGEVARTIPVPREAAGTVQERVIDIPPRLITEFNQLQLQLIGHYTMQCENPLHSSLWANISNNSVLELNVTPLQLRNDLALLPVPFFDPRDVRTLSLPFVFGGTPDTTALEAAGTLSSWFGAQAGYRGAVFPARMGQLPDKGHAVVFVQGQAGVPGLDVPALQGPTVSIVTNPSDPDGKLLLVMGRDGKELKTAATAIAAASQTLSGPTAVISALKELEKRKPYDAPRWLRSDRPVEFGELASARALNVAGYLPPDIRVPLNAPPDLFAWRGKTVPVQLKYRYTPRKQADKSTLNVHLNENFLNSLPIPAGTKDGQPVSQVFADGTLPAEARVELPLYMLTPQSEMQLRYYYDAVKKGECEDDLLFNVRGAIEQDSTIDISGFPHFLSMPNLTAFGNSGFPFTRMADLSETAVVLGPNAGSSEVGAYLSILGRMAASTGHPATAVSVTRSLQGDALAGKDVLVVTSGRDQELLKPWEAHLPYNLDGSKKFRLSDAVYDLFGWTHPGRRDDGKADTRLSVALSGEASDAVFAGLESPVTRGRSVVLVSSNRPDGLFDAVKSLLSTDAEVRSGMRGSVVVVRGDKVDSLLDEQSYHVGSLPLWMSVQWFFARHPLLLLLVALCGIVLLAAVIYLLLRAAARRRLDGNELVER